LVSSFGFLATLHAVLEAAHGLAKITTDIAQLLGAEHQNHYQQYHQPMPDTEGTHINSPMLILRSHANNSYAWALLCFISDRARDALHPVHAYEYGRPLVLHRGRY